ncbi:SLBB domain-containing protein [Carboxylicivirga linearis]|uniref:SLBB domain-containing protein n=1 Tax=Carboxylicivirga linearis TaxID=1628157 RepID=A0ABS5JQK5_9BACT|nr:SLBB domain-containing protein [Carboxylicivirga linearis]MBS2097097.1 SLBB domain-containing protein [Carboxylicivirga linearis]
MKYFLIVFVTVICSLGNVVRAQQIDPSSVNVKELSDSQINQIVNEIEKRGLSDEEAIAVARMKGASSAQINEVMQRIRQARNGSVGIGSTNGGANYQTINDDSTKGNSLSKKQSFELNDADETFGYSLFNTKNLTFEPSVNIPTPKNYILGIGDEVVITVWGASQATYQLQVSKEGTINIPDIGPVNVFGQTFESVSKKIEKHLTGIYQGMKGQNPNTYAEVSLGALRSIKVNVVGEVNVPGTYTVPATAAAYNVLYLSGGPNRNGSFRSIQILRDGKSIETIDVYEFLLRGEVIDNLNLKENDIIYVPSYRSKVHLSGSFKRSGYFETLEETTIADIIELAGGFENNAFQKNLTVIRKTDSELKYKDVAKADFDSFILENGDEIISGQLLNRYENRVTISGAVFRPGSYELSEGMMLTDLIDKAEGFIPEVYMQRGIITRLNEDGSYQNISFRLNDVLEGSWNTQLQREDEVTIRSVQDMKEEELITVKGFVNNPGELPFASNMTLADVIFITGGFQNDADINEIEISRRLSFDEGQEYTNQLGHIFTFNVSRDLQLSDADQDFKIEPYDVINVRKAPGIREGGSVIITGEVMRTGTYSLDNRKERISDLINRSGGLTPLAYSKGAMLQREVKLTEQERVQRQLMIERDSLLGLEMEQHEQVGIRLDKILNNPGSSDDLLLAAGDKIYIPREIRTVKISGNVMNPISMTYKNGKRAKFFIKQAGGFDIRPKRSSVYVVSANGISKTTKNYVLFKRYPKVEPGSEIMVPQRPESNVGVGQWVAIGSAITGLAISITSLANILK